MRIVKQQEHIELSGKRELNAFANLLTDLLKLYRTAVESHGLICCFDGRVDAAYLSFQPQRPVLAAKIFEALRSRIDYVLNFAEDDENGAYTEVGLLDDQGAGRTRKILMMNEDVRAFVHDLVELNTEERNYLKRFDFKLMGLDTLGYEAEELNLLRDSKRLSYYDDSRTEWLSEPRTDRVYAELQTNVHGSFDIESHSDVYLSLPVLEPKLPELSLPELHVSIKRLLGLYTRIQVAKTLDDQGVSGKAFLTNVEMIDLCTEHQRYCKGQAILQELVDEEIIFLAGD